jgi:iron complex outermembrane receptor protein
LKEVQVGLDIFNLLDAHWYDGEFTYASNFIQGAAPALVPLRHVTVGAPRTVLFTLALFI